MKPEPKKQPRTQKPPVRPSLLDPSFKYTIAAQTDVQATWRKFGWKPLAERVQP